LSLLDRTNSISKESPSSLLPPEPKRPLFKREDEPLPTLGPSSLLPDSPGERYPSQEPEQVVAVSPSSLLPPPPTPVLSRGMMLGIVGVFCGIALVLFALAFSGQEKPIPTLMSDAIAYHAAGKHEAAIIQLKNVLAREPDNVDANLLIGKAQLLNGALLDAEKALRRARELGVPAAEVTPLLVEALLGVDRYDDALKELVSTGELSSSGARAALLRGRAFLGLGNLVEARTQFTVARSEAPSEAAVGLARVLMAEGNVDEARKVIDGVTEAFPRIALGWVVKGDLLRGLGQGGEAIAAYRRAQSVQSDNLEASVGIAVSLIAQEEFGEAHKELRKAKAIAPSSHLIHFAEAVLAFKEKRLEASRESIQSVFEIAPKHMPSILLAGTLNLAMGDIEHAHSAFAMFLSQNPGNLQARKLYAMTLLHKKQPSAAAAVLAPFAKLDIRDAEFFYVAGQAFAEAGEPRKAREMFGKAIQLSPNSPMMLTDLGISMISAGDFDAGIRELEKAVALAPRTSRPDRHLALARIARGQMDDALKVVEQLEARLPRAPDAHWIKGLVFASRNDATKARASFERALKLHSGYLPAATALADLDLKEGVKGQARARFEDVLRHDPKSLDAALALVQIDVQEGKVAEAIAGAEKILADHPAAAKPHLVLAQLHRQSGKNSDALNAARRARELNPRDPEAAELLGQIQISTGDFADAVLSFTSLVSLRPRYVQGRIQLSQAQRASNDRRSALAAARDAVAIAPRNADALGFLGALCLEDKRYDEALGIARKIRELHPALALGNALEGDVRLAQGDSKQALEAFKKADALQPSGLLRIKIHQAETAILGRDAPVDGLLDWVRQAPDDVSARLFSADVLVRLGRPSEAVQHYLAVLKIAPSDVRVLNNLADALTRQGDPRALDYAQQAFQIKPNDPVIVTTLGGVLLRSGKLYEAVQVLQKATQLDPANPEIRFQFVQALLKAGDRVRARTELKTILASGKEFPQIGEARLLVGKL